MALKTGSLSVSEATPPSLPTQSLKTSPRPSGGSQTRDMSLVEEYKSRSKWHKTTADWYADSFRMFNPAEVWVAMQSAEHHDYHARRFEILAMNMFRAEEEASRGY